jgi:hypothetical protein
MAAIVVIIASFRYRLAPEHSSEDVLRCGVWHEVDGEGCVFTRRRRLQRTHGRQSEAHGGHLHHQRSERPSKYQALRTSSHLAYYYFLARQGWNS